MMEMVRDGAHACGRVRNLTLKFLSEFHTRVLLRKDEKDQFGF